MTEPNEMLSTLRDVVTRLDQLGIEYMVTGSVAMSSYATARTTMDIDIIVDLAMCNSERFESKFADAYYVDAVSVRRAQDRQTMFNVLNLNTGIKVDFIVRKPTPIEAAKFTRRRRAKVADIEYWVIDKHDLILSKLDWAKDSHSEMQFRDIRNLLESGVDEVVVNDMVAAYGLKGAWEAFVAWKTRIAK